MTKPPLSFIIIGWLCIAAGVIGVVYHLNDPRPFDAEHLLIFAIRLLAIVGGVSLLRGAHWARWLIIAWFAYHAVLSVWHSTSELVLHVLLLIVIGFFLLRPRRHPDEKRAPAGSPIP